MFYDLHIHSCLSPCANDDMTPNNIVQMAKLKGLNLIAVCDHNCVSQQKALAACYKKYQLKGLYGCEVQTQEDVHVLGLFKQLDDVLAFGEWVASNLPFIPNDINYFGHQYITDDNDKVIEDRNGLLLVSIKCTLDKTCEVIHEHHGKVVLAHVLDRANSITHELGFIPEGLAFDALEIKKPSQKDIVQMMHPWLDNPLYLIDSDAHQLGDISEAINELDFDLVKHWWGESS